MSDDLQRAQIIAGVREACLMITCELEQTLRAVMASDDQVAPIQDMFLNHRVSQIATSLAWHAGRRDPERRLQELARELARLWQKAGKDTPEGLFYVALVIRLGLHHELTQISAALQQQMKTMQYQIDEERDEQQRTALARRQRGQLQQYRAEKQRYEALIDAAEHLAGQKLPSASEKPYTLPQEPWTPLQPASLTTAAYEQWMPLARLLLALTVTQGLHTLLRSVDLRWSIQQAGGTICP